ncbi:MAG: hypothetical protein ABSB76_32095, partial [Streptosporangiaceae bacterium]
MLQNERGSGVSEIRDRDIQDEAGNPSQVQTAVQMQLRLGHQAGAEHLPVAACHDIRIIGHLCLGFRQTTALSRPHLRNHTKQT